MKCVCRQRSKRRSDHADPSPEDHIPFKVVNL